MTNQLASLVRRDYFYLDAFWRVNLGMYTIMLVIQHQWKIVIRILDDKLNKDMKRINIVRIVRV